MQSAAYLMWASDFIYLLQQGRAASVEQSCRLRCNRGKNSRSGSLLHSTPVHVDLLMAMTTFDYNMLVTERQPYRTDTSTE